MRWPTFYDYFSQAGGGGGMAPLSPPRSATDCIVVSIVITIGPGLSKGGGARNMKYKAPRMAAIFFYDRDRGRSFLCRLHYDVYDI